MTTPAPGIVAVVVTFESAAVIEDCLKSLALAAPSRGIDIRVVDNASTDGSADRAAAIVGEAHVIRLVENRGFGAGVNAVLAEFRGQYLALVNPDVLVPAGSLDALANCLDGNPGAALVGPCVRDARGALEQSIGYFPSLAREWAHAFYLDVLFGREGRRRRTFPPASEAVDWVSGCLWMLRGEAARAVGTLDESYFLYFEDVDYCWRLRTAGWSVLALPTVEMVHSGGVGSTRSAELPVDLAGAPVLRFLSKFRPGTSPEAAMRALLAGWWIRRSLYAVLALFGDERARTRGRRYALAIGGHGEVLRRARLTPPPRID